MIRSEELESTRIKALRNSGYKATTQRIAISMLRLFAFVNTLRRSRPILKSRRYIQKVTLATIYTTVKILKETGLIHEQIDLKIEHNRRMTQKAG